MVIEDLLAGAFIFVDANVFVYAFTETSKECLGLIERCRREEIHGFVSTPTLAEICHRTMGAEAADVMGQKSVSHKYLEEHPDLVHQLRKYASFLGNVIQRWHIGIIEVSETDILHAQQVRERYGMLTNDSLIAQVMLDYGISAIATNDSAFERIEGIRVFKPGDI